MADIQVLSIGGKEYVSFADARRYLHCNPDILHIAIVQGKVEAEQVESRQLLTWSSVQSWAAERQAKTRG